MTKSARLHRNRRAASPPPMRLTARDLALVQMVAALRIARQDQLQALFFGSRSTAQSRLSPLYQHGFLARHFLPVYVGWSPALYTLDSRGWRHCGQQGSVRVRRCGRPCPVMSSWPIP